MSIRRLLAIPAVLLTLIAGPVSAVADPAFNEEQKSAIEQIVRDYLMKNPEVIGDVMSALEKKRLAEEDSQAQAALQANREALERSSLSYVAGNPDGDVTLVEFFDYNCGYCRHALADLQDLIKTDPNLRVVLKEFPILKQESLEAAKVSIAALRQGKYMEFHVAMLESPGLADMERALSVAKKIGLDMDKVKADIASPDILEPIRESYRLAEALGLNGTPAYVIGDYVVAGAVGYDTLKENVETARSGNCRTC
ncbi:MAG: DsbA family protein [Flavobacteriaceae bacterium]